MNLHYHAEEFHTAAQWNFFTTLHGKNPCDGTGGTVNQLVAYTRLQATRRALENLYLWAKENTTGIIIFHTTQK